MRWSCACRPRKNSTAYGERPSGSVSKLSTFRDGARILRLIFDLVRNERPLQFFGLVGAVLILIAVGLAVPLAETYFETGLVPRLPTAVLAIGLIIIGFLSFLAGLILDVVATMRSEMKRLTYLSYPPVSAARAEMSLAADRALRRAPLKPRPRRRRRAKAYWRATSSSRS